MEETHLGREGPVILCSVSQQRRMLVRLRNFKCRWHVLSGGCGARMMVVIGNSA